MADYLELESVKKHLHVDFNDDDTYITGLMNMVENAVSIEIGENLINLIDVAGNLPLRLHQAMLLLIGHFYLIREPIIIGVSVTKIPYGFDWLIAPFKIYTIA